jgi:hypothetical protein
LSVLARDGAATLGLFSASGSGAAVGRRHGSLKRERGMRFSVLLVGIAAFFVVAGPVLVSQAAADDATTCMKAGGDDAIAACTLVIQNRGALTKSRADAY